MKTKETWFALLCAISRYGTHDKSNGTIVRTMKSVTETPLEQSVTDVFRRDQSWMPTVQQHVQYFGWADSENKPSA